MIKTRAIRLFLLGALPLISLSACAHTHKPNTPPHTQPAWTILDATNSPESRALKECHEPLSIYLASLGHEDTDRVDAAADNLCALITFASDDDERTFLTALENNQQIWGARLHVPLPVPANLLGPWSTQRPPYIAAPPTPGNPTPCLLPTQAGYEIRLVEFNYSSTDNIKIVFDFDASLLYSNPATRIAKLEPLRTKQLEAAYLRHIADLKAKRTAYQFAIDNSIHLADRADPHDRIARLTKTIRHCESLTPEEFRIILIESDREVLKRNQQR